MTAYPLAQVEIRTEDARPKKTRPPGQGALNPQQLVPLCRPLAAGKGPDFQLARIGRDRQVTDERIFRLARAGADDGTPAGFLRQLDSSKGLGKGADLIRLDQHSVRGPLFDSLLD